MAGAQAREPRVKWSVTEIPSLPLLHGLLSFVDALKGINRIYNVVIIDEVINHQCASIAGNANFSVWLIQIGDRKWCYLPVGMNTQPYTLRILCKYHLGVTKLDAVG